MKQLDLRPEILAERQWIQHAACRGIDSETRNQLFFPEVGQNSSAGKAVCLGVSGNKARTGRQPCPVLTECLEYALSLPPRETQGIWAGTTIGERHEILRKRQAERRKLEG